MGKILESETYSPYFGDGTITLNVPSYEKWIRTCDTPSEFVMKVMGGDLEQVARLSIKTQPINDVYAGLPVTEETKIPVTGGIKEVLSYNEMLEVVDSDNPDVRKLIPLAATMTLRLPVSAQLDTAAVTTFVRHALGCFCGPESASCWNDYLYRAVGCLIPKGKAAGSGVEG